MAGAGQPAVDRGPPGFAVRPQPVGAELTGQRNGPGLGLAGAVVGLLRRAGQQLAEHLVQAVLVAQTQRVTVGGLHGGQGAVGKQYLERPDIVLVPTGAGTPGKDIQHPFLPFLRDLPALPPRPEQRALGDQNSRDAVIRYFQIQRLTVRGKYPDNIMGGLVEQRPQQQEATIVCSGKTRAQRRDRWQPLPEHHMSF